MKKFWKFENVDDTMWQDWKWQMKNCLNNNSNLREFFPNISDYEVESFEEYKSRFNLAITPYTLSLVELDDMGNPVENDPVWNQFRYYKKNEMQGITDYDGIHENWETSDEMPTRILQHKYPDRAIIRIVNACFSHCNYCYMASRVLDMDTAKHKAGNNREWEKSLEYLKMNPQIRDVLISGGDPLILNNSSIERILSDLSCIPSVKSIRLNTRFVTFNPYRLDEELAGIFKKYRLTALEIHAVHPREINDVLDKHLEVFDKVGYRPLILWRAPLLKGINDSVDVLEELFVKLYQRRITPYYLFHYAPFSLGRSTYGLSVKKGSALMSELRRRIPGPAFPRYTLFHIEGKHDIPIDDDETSTFKYTKDEKGNTVIRFKNWRGHWVEYPDID